MYNIILILGLVGFAGTVIGAILLIVMILRDKPLLIPGILLLVSALLVGVAVFMIICEDSEPEDKNSSSQSTGDQSDYIPAPTEIYDTSADENGLGDMNMYVDGAVKSFDSKKGVKYCEVETEDGKLQIISVPLGTPKAEWDKLKEEERVRIYFQYLGYSDDLDMASGMLLAVGNPSDDKATVSGTPYVEPEDNGTDDNGIWSNKFTPVNDFRYTLDKETKTVTLIQYRGDDKKIMLSPVYTIGGENYNLTSLGDDGCFFGEISLTSIYIPEGVTHFSHNCFNSCSSLQYLYIPATMQDL